MINIITVQGIKCLFVTFKFILIKINGIRVCSFFKNHYIFLMSYNAQLSAHWPSSQRICLLAIRSPMRFPTFSLWKFLNVGLDY